MKRNRILLSGALGLGAAATLWTARIYYDEKYSALARLRSGSRVIRTPTGVTEYASEGEGPPVLVIHGGGGGYDQGMIVADSIGSGFHWIAPSRFGYLRTPMQPDSSAAAQADAYASLLDFLDLEAATIIGFSAGGPSALQFALRHPDRCRGLALFSTINQPLPHRVMPYVPLLKQLGRFIPDFGVWMVAKTVGPSSIRWLVRSLEVNEACDVEFVRALQQACLPMGERLAGTMNDLIKAQSLPPFPFEQITVPTLVIHGTADTLVPFSQAEAAGSRIPRAIFKPIQGGSHIWLATHKNETVPVIRDFLNQLTS